MVTTNDIRPMVKMLGQMQAWSEHCVASENTIHVMVGHWHSIKPYYTLTRNSSMPL